MTEIYVDVRCFDKNGTIGIRLNHASEGQLYWIKYDQKELRELKEKFMSEGHGNFEFISMAGEGQGKIADSLIERIAYIFNSQ